tara:strand:+ start:1039 stop:1320 length:282 start_codon:yes stop_codon:yes gene_type:complete
MATESLVFKTLTTASTATTFGTSTLGYDCSIITIINNGTNAITISNGGDSFATSISLVNGQGITLEAEDIGTTLPEIRVTTGSGTTSVSVAHN